MKKIVRRSVLVIIVVAGMMTGLYARGKTDSQSGTSSLQKITLWSQFADPNSNDSGSIAFYQALASTRKQFPDIEIEHLGMGGEAYKAKLPVASAADELPDIFFAWGGGASEPFVAGKRVLQIDKFAADGTLSRLVPGSTDNFIYDGKLYGLPLYISTGNLYVNKELLATAGVKIPTDWNEFIFAVNALKEKGITPVALGAKDRWPVLFWASILNIRMGGSDAMNAALRKTGSFDTPEFVAAANKYKELIDMGTFGANFIGTSYDDAVNSFLTGKAAMILMGGWVNSQIESENSLVNGKVIPIKFPLITGGKGNVDEWYGGCGETFLINAKVKNPEKVWEVYKYLIETMSREAFLAGSGACAWNTNIGDTSKVSPLAVEISNLTMDAKGFSYWWDQMLNGNDTESMFGSLMRLSAGKITPEAYTKELQMRINSGK